MFKPAASGLSALHFLWNHYQGRFSIISANDGTWLDEFFFCLLGGYSISFELNKSAFLKLKEKGLLNPDLPWENVVEISEAISSELRLPQFLPLRSNGGFRSYRFPQKKSETIAQAGHWLKQICNFELNKIVVDYSDSKESREILLECPGFGYKSASWFLRNIGKGDRLAILDIHVLRTLRDFYIIPDELDIPSNYLEIENIYCLACDLVGAEAQLMDLIIWSWARGDYYVQQKYTI